MPGKLWFRALAAAVGGPILALAPPAQAVIQVDFPVSRIWGASRIVLVGAVSSVNPDNRVVDVKVVDAPKGQAEGDRLRIQIVSPAEVVQSVAAEQPVVVFIADDKGKSKGPPVAIVHLADTWLLAQAIPAAQTPAWRVGQVYQGRQSFPGRTAALARMVCQMATGRDTLLDKVEHNVFRGGVRELARLAIPKPLCLTAADVNGDGKPDLLIDTVAGSRLFLAGETGYQDVTNQWCPWGAAGGCRAFGDVSGDGKVDCLQNHSIYLNTGGGFAATKATLDLPDKVAPLAAGLMDATGDGKADALILSAAGELRIFENGGSTDGPWKAAAPRTLWQGNERPAAAVFGDWGDDGRPHVIAVWPDRVMRYAVAADGAPPADYERLTGLPLAKYHKAHAAGLKNVKTVAMDINADARPDFLLLADGGGLLLVNRGYGAYLVNPDAGGALVSRGRNRVPFTLTPATPWAAADVEGDGFDDLLILADDGTLYLVSNTPYPTGSGKPGK